jgi:hypothetical protein
MVDILGPIDCVFANKFIKKSKGTDDTTKAVMQAPQHKHQGELPKNKIFKMGMELL